MSAQLQKGVQEACTARLAWLNSAMLSSERFLKNCKHLSPVGDVQSYGLPQTVGTQAGGRRKSQAEKKVDKSYF